MGELIKQKFDLDMVMVPFNGAPLAVNSAMGNHTPIAFSALPPALGNIRDGSVRGIAIFAKARVASLPDLPTSEEEGVPGLESDTLTGIVFPAGTPQAIVDRWHEAIVKMAAESRDQTETRYARLHPGRRIRPPNSPSASRPKRRNGMR